MFNLVGYAVMTLVWTTVRGDAITAPATTTDPLTAIIDNTLSDQSAATVVVLAAGYVSIDQSELSIDQSGISIDQSELSIDQSELSIY